MLCQKSRNSVQAQHSFIFLKPEVQSNMNKSKVSEYDISCRYILCMSYNISSCDLCILYQFTCFSTMIAVAGKRYQIVLIYEKYITNVAAQLRACVICGSSIVVVSSQTPFYLFLMLAGDESDDQTPAQREYILTITLLHFFQYSQVFVDARSKNSPHIKPTNSKRPSLPLAMQS